MFGDKAVIWENDLGQSITFDNENALFVESIDMTGTTGIHTAELLADADGQASVAHHLSAKTIPCSFAWCGDDGTTRERLAQIFSPLRSGTLTVLTKHSDYSTSEQYQIDCRPQNVPTFKRDTNLNVWRFDVDFVADFPYWRHGTEQSVRLTNVNTIIHSECPFDIPPIIYLPALNGGIQLEVAYGGSSTDSWSTPVPMFEVAARNYAVWIDVQTMNIRKANGAFANHVVSVTANIDKALIRYGDTRIICTAGESFSGDHPTVYYYDLSMGEV